MTGAPPNRLKARLRAGERTRGCWLTLQNDTATEIAGRSGADWCLIDGEHAPFDPGAILRQLRVLAATPAEPIVRVPDTQGWMLKQVLDLGVQTVLAPMIDSAEAARALVAACRYPPAGHRGMGPLIARAGGYGARPDYAATADDQLCIIAQIESAAALAEIEQIAAVDGIDGLFIGPADLAADLQTPPDELAATIDRAMTRIAATGCAPGIFTTPLHAPHYEALGSRITAIGSDGGALHATLTEMFR